MVNCEQRTADLRSDDLDRALAPGQHPHVHCLPSAAMADEWHRALRGTGDAGSTLIATARFRLMSVAL